MTRLRRHESPTERDLVALADGSLPAARRASVERAVAASPELQASLAAQRRALGLSGDAAAGRAPASLRERIALAGAPTRRAAPGRMAGGLAAAAAAAAAAFVVVLAVGGGATGAPTVADAAVLATRAPLAPAAAHRGETALLPRPRAAGLAFPYWDDRFSFKAIGVRTDRVAGRLATTVFYARAGQRIAYTIVAGSPLAVGSATRSTVSDKTRLRSFSAHGRLIVTWLRRGHTCVLSGTNVPLSALLRLASWKGGGEIAY